MTEPQHDDLPAFVPSPSAVPPHQRAGYDAVWTLLQEFPGGAEQNAVVWRAVEAYRLASEPEHERELRERAAGEIAAAAEPYADTRTGPRASFRRGMLAAARRITPAPTPRQILDAIAEGRAVVCAPPDASGGRAPRPGPS
ncbi:hypothetical protein [Actinomadura opuntiae]|uniref:hypothetical protein n=1 Tax=Actinomadura sp. OS1-43 TaxID=604315 RepID=UPI00255A84B2|nr:hypothetical protein [Actinomadura sp. OS1-43]MDL4812754.1 hypothetical protein [Actinomadura sp. OS1-43]